MIRIRILIRIRIMIRFFLDFGQEMDSRHISWSEITGDFEDWSGLTD